VKQIKISTFLLTFLTSSSAIVISFIVLSVTFLIVTNRYFVEKQTDSLFTSAEGISKVVEYATNGDSVVVNERLLEFLSLISGFTGNNVIVTDETGLVIATSDAKQPEGLYVGRGEIASVIFDGSYSEIGSLGGLYAYEHFSAGIPIVSPSGTIAGTVFVSYPSTNFRATILKLERLFVLTVFIVLIFSTLLIYVSMQRMSRPLISMSAAVREFARGNFKVRVPYDGNNSEVSQLASSFNHMASELERTEELRREFIANISHELKTPMTNIGGYVDGILDGIFPKEREADYLKIVSSEIKRLSRLVTQMLEMSRLDSTTKVDLKREPFDICEQTRLVILGLENKIVDNGLDIEADFDDKIEVIGEKDSITRVIFNLMDNAIKYSKKGSTIKINIRRQGGKAITAITNEGTPISPDDQKRIFTRFYQTDRSHKSEGLGLGLYMVKTIMGRHGEDVWCESIGGITTMSFTLPIAGR